MSCPVKRKPQSANIGCPNYSGLALNPSYLEKSSLSYAEKAVTSEKGKLFNWFILSANHFRMINQDICMHNNFRILQFTVQRKMNVIVELRINSCIWYYKLSKWIFSCYIVFACYFPYLHRDWRHFTNFPPIFIMKINK